jgi:amino acid adenylation domain-containing protein
MNDVQRRQVLFEFNNTDRVYPSDATLHGLFESQAMRTPEATAAVFENESLTYRQLNNCANVWAHRLRELGVHPNVPVGVCLERGLHLPATLLGILKAGGGYVALDPDYPSGRLSFVLAESRIPILITTRRLAESLPHHQSQTVYVNANPVADMASAADNPSRLVGPTDLAYVLYTSGSTGRPKGVMISHRAATNRLFGMQEDYRLSPSDVVLQKTPFSFDVSIWELFWTLMTGARMVIAKPHGHQDPGYLIDLIRRHGVTTLHFVPPVLDVFLQHPQAASCYTIKRMFCGGESLSCKTQQRFFEHLDAELHHLYGPTEATIDVTSWVCQRHSHLETVPIGRPVQNVRLYVLDPQMNPVPVGAPGELYAGGVQVAIGYLNRPDLTAERFIPDPFNEVPGSCLYRTGDLVRWRADGNLEFLGRLDDQVKLRGFRIELGEIEAVLARHPSVRQAVVLLREDRPGDKRLAAYIVPQPAEAPFTMTHVRRSLQDELPEYMVPSAFIVQKSLPLMPNGKVDRKALPALEVDREELQQSYIAPQTPVEELLAGIWENVLGVEKIGIHDNFFELGGHSLLATQVISRLRDAFAVELPVRSLFEAPTAAELGARIEGLRSREPAEAISPLARVPRDGILPLSFAQEREWFLEQFGPASAVYNLPWILRLRGLLNVPALERSLRELVRRHEVLRTTVTSVNGQLQPVLHDAVAFGLTVTDLRNLPQAGREAEARRAVVEEGGRPFDLSQDLMLRARLWLVGDQDQVLALTMHHIASDGWSVGVLDRELTTLYAAYSTDQLSPLPELPIQYVDYAVWQRGWLQGAVLERQLAYWKPQLSGAPAMLGLPTDFPRPAVQSYRGASQELVLNADLTQALQALSRREGVTLFMMLLAAFQVLLSRYSGQEDVLVGAPIAGRNRTEVEGLIGFFVNTLVLRTDLSGNPTFQELLRRVREVTLGAYAHQDLPFEKLVEELKPERNLSHSPLFQVMFVMQNAPWSPLALAEVTVNAITIDSSTSKFDLTLALDGMAGALRGTVEYNTDLFKAETVARFVGHFTMLLEGIVADPGQRIGALPLLTADEHQLLFVAGNGPATEYPRDYPIHRLYERQVEHTPDATAMVSGTTVLSYQELNVLANRVAHGLQRRGIRPGDLVGVCLRRSTDLVAVLLGILKAGAAYVPVDPAWPAGRRTTLLQTARVALVLTDSDLAGKFACAQLPLLLLAPGLTAAASEPTTNLPESVGADDLAYVLYTSGSSDTPKGVAVRHRSVVRLLVGVTYADLGPERTFLQLAPIHFDASTFELWGALLHGARLVLAPEGVPEPDQLEALLLRERVCTLWLTAGLFNTLIDLRPDMFRHVRQLLIGGEALSVPHVRRALKHLPQTRLINGYGPTEGTTFTCCYPIPRVLPEDLTSIPIGRPISNTRVRVLDGHGRLVPVGVPGELFIGGDGIAAGYLHDPERTVASFVPNPLGEDADRILYRTGDRVRWLAGGMLEFLGRIDDQVKLRGFRIEPGEIETVLNEHPSVAHSVVILREDRRGDKRLMAYCVPAGGAALDVTDLTRHLRTRLPDYMVPWAFVRLEALPLTPSGKINRRALPAPDDSRPELETRYVAPRNRIEQQLASIWRELLALDRIGVDDNFFALGGHSLLAIRLFTRIEQAFGRKLPLAVLFQHGTIGHLANLLADSIPVTKVATVMPLQPGGDGRPLFVMPSIAGELLLSRALIEELGKRFPVLGIQPPLAAPNLDQFRDFRTTARCFVSALRTYQPYGPYALVGFSYGGIMAFEVACLLTESGENVDLLAVIDTGPGRRGLKPQFGDRWRRLCRIAANLPSWFREECRQFSISRLAGSSARKVRRFYRLLASGGCTGMELDDVFDVSRIPSQNRELMQTVFAAFRDYVPRPYAGKLTLFRANTRPLLSDCLDDLGWGQYVGAVDVRPINGNHESILHQPHVGELTRQLAELLVQVTEIGRCSASRYGGSP